MVKKFLKVISRILLVLAALLIVFVIFNQFDAGKNPRAFTTKDLPQANFDKNNGYYRIWALSELPQADINSDAVINKYRKIFYPEFNKEHIKKFVYKEYKDMFSARGGEKIKAVFKKAGLKWNPYQGNWQEGVGNILAHVTAAKKAVKGSRLLITNLIGKIILRDAVYALADLMNREDCPRQIFEMVFHGLAAIEYEEYGSGNSIISEYLIVSRILDGDLYSRDYNFFLRLFIQKNRTKNYIYDYYSKMIAYEKTPPYQWESPIPERPDYTGGGFWWLQNFQGKVIFDI